MLKFVKHNLETINGVDIFPTISLIIFFTIFFGYMIYAFSFSKEQVKELSQLPFNDSNN